MTFALRPVTLKFARRWIRTVHRHHKEGLTGALWAVAAEEGERLIGIAVVGLPKARMLRDGRTCEVVRLATDGTRNACSYLYRAAWRAAIAHGYNRLVTYTLVTESGASLRAAGFRLVGKTRGGSWNRPSRPRTDKGPTCPKHRWELAA